MLDASQIVLLRTELQTDPLAYGYAAQITAGSDTNVATLVNLVRNGTTVPKSSNGQAIGTAGAAVVVARVDVTPQEVIEAIAVVDFAATPAGVNNITWAGSWFESMMQLRAVTLLKAADLSNTRVMTNILKLLTNGSASETRLTAVGQRNGSRAEKLFGAGVVVSTDEVAAALRP
jgi:hypothetical protein